MKRFENQVAVITDGADGLGKGIAEINQLKLPENIFEDSFFPLEHRRLKIETY